MADEAKNLLLRLYETKRFADFTLIDANQTEYLVHKFMLDDKCEYFRNLFKVEKKNAPSKLSFPEDISSEAIGAFVKFLYTNEVPLTTDWTKASNHEITELSTNEPKNEQESITCNISKESSEYVHDLEIPASNEALLSKSVILPRTNKSKDKQDNIIYQLFELADYFQCASLQQATVNEIESNLSPTSLDGFVNFFDRHPNQPALRLVLLNYIVHNYETLVEKEFRFQNLGALIEDVMKEIANRTRLNISDGDKFTCKQWGIVCNARWFGNQLHVGNGSNYFQTLNGEGKKLLSKQRVPARVNHYTYNRSDQCEGFVGMVNNDTILFCSQSNNYCLFERN